MTEIPTPPATHRLRPIVIASIAGILVGAFGGGIAAAALRDSVAAGVGSSLTATIASCRDRVDLLTSMDQARVKAFDALVADDPVTAISEAATAGEYQKLLDELDPC